MCAGHRPTAKFDLYPVEGGTAAMCYIFKALTNQRLLNAVDIVVTRREATGRTLAELARDPRVRTVFLRRLSRGGADVPLYPGVRIGRGDVLLVVGSRKHVAEAAAFIGYADRPTDATDMVYVALFIFLGGLIGIPALHLGALELGLGVAVGTLIGGLVAGWWARRWNRHGTAFISVW